MDEKLRKKVFGLICFSYQHWLPGGCTSDGPGLTGGAATGGPDLPRAADAGIGVPGTSWVLISHKKIEFKHWTLTCCAYS